VRNAVHLQDEFYQGQKTIVNTGKFVEL